MRSITERFSGTLITHARDRTTHLVVNDNVVCDLTELMCGMHTTTPPTKELSSTHLHYGPRWHSVQQLYGSTAQTQVFAALVLSTVAASDTIALHSTLLDIASSVVEQLSGFHTDSVPSLYQDLRLHRPLPNTLHVMLTVNRHGEKGDSCAFTLYGMADETVVRCVAMVKRKVQLHTQDTDDDIRLHVSSVDNHQLWLATKGEGAGKLALCPTPRLALGDSQVEIEVLATGLNFKDVLFITGLPRQQPGGAPLQLGLEYAGRIIRVDKNVTEFTPGEDVMAVLNGDFVQYARVESGCVVRKPVHCRIEQAAALPVAYLTAYYVLVVCANLQPGERVLVHSAARGVGLATLHITKRCGTQIFVAAGSERRRDYLLLLSVYAVADSHGEQFAATLLIVSDGQEMDVILDSLTGRLLDVSLALLVPLGRLLEPGNKDIVGDKALPIRFPTQGDIFIPVNFHTACGAFSRYLQQIVAWIDDNALPLLPHKFVPLLEVAYAFTILTTPQHIGKVVAMHRITVSMDRLNATIAERRLGGYALSMGSVEVMR